MSSTTPDDTADEGGLFSTKRGSTKTAVIVPIISIHSGQGTAPGHRANPRTGEARLEEAVGLANAINGLEVVFAKHYSLRKYRPATLVGQGMIDEVKQEIAQQGVELLIVDHALTPVQQRNLEKALQIKVLDRTGIILEIFGERAQTKEGTLQVELAHLNYQKGRLVRSWTHLERQRGGGGFMGGPGETQIESDRRMLQQRIKYLESALADVRKTRDLHRKNRKRKPHPIVALVGYTNAGKSTLFNRVTEADVRAEDLLFATLDPTLRTVELPHGDTVILSDTVGFVSDLPHDLVAAFRATLEEVIDADLIVHIRDIAHEDTDAQAADVRDILQQLKINPDDASRVIEVWNKIDLLPQDDPRREIDSVALADGQGFPVSASTGQGIAELIAHIEQKIAEKRSVFSVLLPLAQLHQTYWLYDHAEVLKRIENETDGSVRLDVRIDPKNGAEFRNRFGTFILPEKEEIASSAA